MARFLFAWELGVGLGHVLPLAQLARPLVERGHELALVLKDLSSARAVLGALADSPRMTLWQAPVWLLPLQGQAPAVSYAELLHRAGYLDAGRLRGLVQGWRQLFDAIRPDLLLIDHAPTALLAAQGLPLRRVMVGNGFFQPPAGAPMPGFLDDDAISPLRLAQTEALALAICNAVLVAEGRPALNALHELLAVDQNFLLTWPQLDPYGHGPEGRPGGDYWGPLPVSVQGVPALWPDGDGPALLAYLKGDYAALEPVLQQLAKAPCRTLAHVVGLNAVLRQRWSGQRLRFATEPVQMSDALSQAAAVLCHGGAGTVAAALQAGRPLLLLPMHGEQAATARRVQAAGPGACLRPNEVPVKLKSTLTRLLADNALTGRVQAFAAARGAAPGADVSDALARRCEQLLAAA